MGLKFVVSEAQTRSTQASQASSQAQQAAALQQSIQIFLSAPLSSKAYDSAKNYFMVAYTPICQSIIMTGEALANAHKKFLSEYLATVNGSDLDEDQLVAEIDNYKALLDTIDDLIRDAKTHRTDLERCSMNAYQAMQKRQEKLEKFRTYSGQSASYFSDYQSSQSELNNGLAQVQDCKAWNASTGTFDIQKLDMSWAKPINTRWEQREKMKKQEKDAQIKQAIGKLDGYEIVKTQSGTWYLMKDGKIVSPDKYPELYTQLEICKDSLKEDQYTKEELKISRDEVAFIPGVGGAVGALGKGMDLLRKGAGIVKIRKNVIDAINNAPTVNLAVERAIDDVLKDAEDTTKNKRKKPKNFEKDGEYPDALNDFDSLGLDDVSNLSNGEGMKGTLSDGRKVIVRPTSKSGGATIEIQTPDGKAEIKIRYKK